MKIIALTSLLGLGLLLGACAAPTSEGATASTHERVVVTAEDTSRLAPSERLEEPFFEGYALRFDASKGPIDFGRVDLVDEQGGSVSMDAVVQEMAGKEGVLPASFQQRTFEIAPEKADLAASSAEAAGEPAARPQMAMKCYYRYCLGLKCWYIEADCP